MNRSAMPFSFLVVFATIGLAAVVSCLVMVFGGSSLAGGPDPGPFYHENGPGQAMREKLATAVTLDKGIDPNTPLKDALEFLSDRYDVTIIVDSNAFAQIGVQKVEEQPVQLPKMSGIPLSTVLRLLLGQVKGDMYAGTYQIRDGHIEVTTTYHQ